MDDKFHDECGVFGIFGNVFLRIFEKVGRPDTLPLKGNRFKVDASIQEVTLLVFRGPGSAAPTRTTVSPAPP